MCSNCRGIVVRNIICQFIVVMLASFICTPSNAEQISFSSGWTQHDFPLMRAASFSPSQHGISFKAQNATSIYYKPFLEGRIVPDFAAFQWELSATPQPTPLNVRYGADRPLTLSFVFAPPAVVPELARVSSPQRVISRSEVRTLSYVWGGVRGGITSMPSPWLPKTAMLEIVFPSEPGEGALNLSVSRDLAQHFGKSDYVLIALSISVDTTDTNGLSQGRIRNLELR